MIPKIAMASAAVLLASCASYVGPTYVAKLGNDLSLSGGSYTSGGGLTVAADFREKDGMTLVCGVWAQSKAQSVLTKHKARGVVATGSIFHGRERVAQGLSFMREVDPQADYAGSEANCRLTERAWRAGDNAADFTVRLPRQLVYFDADEFTGGVSVYFRPTGPGAGEG